MEIGDFEIILVSRVITQLNQLGKWVSELRFESKRSEELKEEKAFLTDLIELMEMRITNLNIQRIKRDKYIEYSFMIMPKKGKRRK